MKSSGGEHFLGLDHVRALAACLVFSWHFTHYYNGYPVAFASAPTVFPLAIFDEGHTGVGLFMTLSGYLFAKLLDGKDVHFPSFLWNRFLRLAPLMFLVLAYFGDWSDPVGELYRLFAGLNLSALPNGLWSVMVEFHFYLVLPLLLRGFRQFRMAGFVILAVTITLRIALYAYFGEIQSWSYWTIIGRIDQFVLGIAAFGCSDMLRGKHLIAGAVAIGFTAFYWLFDYSGGFYGMPTYPSPSLIWIILPTVEGAAYALLIAYYDRSFAPRNTGASWLIGLAGSYSYSIYLLHFFFVFTAAIFIHEHVMDISNFYLALGWALLCFIAMIPIGYLSFRFVESPFLRYRKRYIRAPEEAPAGSIGARP